MTGDDSASLFDVFGLRLGLLVHGSFLLPLELLPPLASLATFLVLHLAALHFLQLPLPASMAYFSLKINLVRPLKVLDSWLNV